MNDLNDRSMALQCPRCSSGPERLHPYRGADPKHRNTPVLVESLKETGVEVVECELCGGLWLLDGQLRQLLDHRLDAGAMGGRQADLAVRDLWRRSVARAQSDDLEVPCPACSEPTFRHEWKQSQVMIDTCLACYGVWLDGGELQQLESYLAALTRRS